MLLFFSFCIVSIIFFHIAEKKDKFFPAFIGISILTIIAGFRDYSVGTDTKVYHNLFMNFYYGYGLGTNEKGFMYIAKAIMTLFGDDRAVFVFYAFVINFFIIWMLWKFRTYGSFTLMCFLFVTLLFPQTLNIMRQFVGLSIVFAATYLLFKNRYILYVAITIIASFLFHRSMLIAVTIALIWFLINKGSSTKKWLILLLTIACIPFVTYPIIDVAMEYSFYFLNSQFAISQTFMIEVFLFFTYAILYFFKNLKEREVEVVTLDRFLFINYFLSILFGIVGCYFTYMGRIGLCYSLMTIPCIARICKNNRYSQLYRIAYVLFALMYIVVKVTILGECQIFPYSFG